MFACLHVCMYACMKTYTNVCKQHVHIYIYIPLLHLIGNVMSSTVSISTRIIVTVTVSKAVTITATIIITVAK